MFEFVSVTEFRDKVFVRKANNWTRSCEITRNPEGNVNLFRLKLLFYT